MEDADEEDESTRSIDMASSERRWGRVRAASKTMGRKGSKRQLSIRGEQLFGESAPDRQNRHKRNLKKVNVPNPYLEDQKIDVEASEFMMKQLHISLENITFDCYHANLEAQSRRSKKRVTVPPSHIHARKSICGDEMSPARRASIRAGLESAESPEVRLMRCIEKVMTSNAQQRVQEQLQNLMFQFLMPETKPLSEMELPCRMESPRSEMNTLNRLGYFHQIQQKGTAAKYLVRTDGEPPEQPRKVRVGYRAPGALDSLSKQLHRSAVDSTERVEHKEIHVSKSDEIEVSAFDEIDEQSDCKEGNTFVTEAITIPQSRKLPAVSTNFISIEEPSTPVQHLDVHALIAKASAKTSGRTKMKSKNYRSFTLCRFAGKYYTAPESLLLMRGETPPASPPNRRPRKLSETVLFPELETGKKVKSETEILYGGAFTCLEAKAELKTALASQGLTQGSGRAGAQSGRDWAQFGRALSSLRAEEEVNHFIKQHGLHGLVRGGAQSSSAPDLRRTSFFESSPAAYGRSTSSSASCRASLSRETRHSILMESANNMRVNDEAKRRETSKEKRRAALPPVQNLPSFPMLCDLDGQCRQPTNEIMKRPEQKYFQACDKVMRPPRIIKNLCKPSGKIDLGALGLRDADLQALQDSLLAESSARNSQPLIEELSLSGNMTLGDVCISNFLSRLGSVHDRLCAPLRVLDLEDCRALGDQSINELVSLMGGPLSQIHELNLSGISVPHKCWRNLSKALSDLALLRRLRLARTRCGLVSQDDVIQIARVISATVGPLEELDISGNYLLHQGCQALGEELRAGVETLIKLDCSFNAGFGSQSSKEIRKDVHISYVEGIGPTYNPIMLVMEALGETCVTHANFVNCHVAYEEDCLLEDIVPSSDITDLDVSGNIHGGQGTRCMVRLVTMPLDRECGHVERLHYGTGLREHDSSSLTVFDYSDPSAHYNLDLAHPQHRSILRMLLKRCELMDATLSDAFFDTLLNNRPLQTPLESLCFKRLDRGGDDWQVPFDGNLRFNFRIPLSYERLEDATEVFKECQRTSKVAVGLTAFVRLVKLFEECQDMRSQEIMITAMSKDLVFKMCQVKHLGNMAPHLFPFIVKTLLAAVEEGASRMALFDLVSSASNRHDSPVCVQTKNILLFNAKHPDGHYFLNLANYSDAGVAQRLIILTCWEKRRSVARSMADVSQHGNYESIRNAKHMGINFAFQSDWSLPLEGTLELDYVSPEKLSPLEKKTLSEAAFTDFLDGIKNSTCRLMDKIHALNLIAHQIVVTPDQVKQVIEVFPAWNPTWAEEAQTLLAPRLEVFVTLYNRCLFQPELISTKVLYNPELLHLSEIVGIRERLGHIHTFHGLLVDDESANLGNRHGPLDLSVFDSWTVAKYIIQLAQKEPGDNVKEAKYSEFTKAGFEDRGYAFIIPATWFPNPPSIGDFTCTYYVKPEEQRPQTRLALAKSLLGWHSTYVAGLD